MVIKDRIVALKDGRNAVLRSAQITDVLQLNDSFNKTKTQTRFISMAPEDITSVGEQEERIERYLCSKSEALMVAVVGGEIAGSCTFGSRKSTSRTRHRASIGIAIEESYTNVGLGSKMIEYAIELCKDMGFERLELGYIEGNRRACKVYKRLGFEETGRVVKALKYSDGSYADEVLMSLDLLSVKCSKCQEFNYKQLKEIEIGRIRNIDTSIYARDDFDFEQMRVIRKGLERGVDVSIYAKPEYDALQMKEILYGLTENLDVSIYAKPEFDASQMWEIVRGLDDKLNVLVYAKPEYSCKQMREMRFALKSGLSKEDFERLEID